VAYDALLAEVLAFLLSAGRRNLLLSISLQC
jgi:hypothetical protein